MSGIYIHIPYCKHKCEYCDFYSEVSLNDANIFHHLIEKELKLRANFLPQKNIETIYFGGGTPSLLKPEQIFHIIDAVKKEFSVDHNPEVTLEANPDDLSYEYLKGLFDIGINRLSIGVQSFADTDLLQLGRRHNAKQAVTSVENAYKAGFKNISIDLIYGLPYSSNEIWENNLNTAFSLPVQHLSCYHLIIEEGTPLSEKVSKGNIKPVEEDDSVKHFQILQRMAKKNNFVHYEISNLAREGYFSRHNSSYWKQTPYLGLGPSAHSYNGMVREWNPKSTKQWSTAINAGKIIAEQEVLSEKDKLNEYLLTSLRTIWGVNIIDFEEQFGSSALKKLMSDASPFLTTGAILKRKNILLISPDAFLISDSIITELFQ